MTILTFGTEVLPMTCRIEARSVQSFGLYVTDASGDPADISGSVATLEDAETDEILFTAVTDDADSVWRWDLTVNDTSDLGWRNRQARLVVTSGGERRVWAEGVIQVHA